MILASINMIGLLSDKSRTSLVVLGFVALVSGLMLMMRHKSEIDEVNQNITDPRIKLFEQRKFRRRSLASTFVASIGVLMIALNWAIEPGVFIGLISVLLLLLLAVMFIAILDVMSVGLHTLSQDDSARQKMVDEYLRQRKKLLDRADDQESP